MKTKGLVFSNISMAVVLTAIVVSAYAFTFTKAFAATVPTVNVSINNESNANVTSVPVGTVVRLNTSVSSSTGPTATGSIDFSSYQNTSCSGTASVQSGVALVNGSANSATTTVGSNGLSYKATYVATGDVYASTTSSCVSVTGTVVTPTPTPTPTPTGIGSISGTAFNDLNKNKTKDSGEAGIGGFTVKLYGGTFWWNWGKPRAVATTTTDANGNYSFTGLADGIYRVEETKLTGWAQISGDFRWVLVVNGKSLTGLDFANISKANGSGTATSTPNKKDKDEKRERKEEKREEHREKKINKLMEKIKKVENKGRGNGRDD
jgi:hypothetical protein